MWKPNKANDYPSTNIKGLENLKIFLVYENTFGLPTKLFVLGTITTLAITIILHWIPGILFGAIYFYGMYNIHRNDEKGFEVWRKALIRFYYNKTGQWDTVLSKSTRIVIFKKD